MKLLTALLIVTMAATPAMAKGKKDKDKKSSTPVVQVAPAPTPAPTPKPATATGSYTVNLTPGQIRAMSVDPLANCTYCGAAAVARGDLSVLETIGNPVGQ